MSEKKCPYRKSHFIPFTLQVLYTCALSETYDACKFNNREDYIVWKEREIEDKKNTKKGVHSI